MKGYSPTRIETSNSSTKPSFSLELGMIKKCDCQNCKDEKCTCVCHK